MYKYLFMISFIFSSFHSYAQDPLGLYRCAPESKDPKCWERVSQIRMIGDLKCASNGKVQYIINHGNGSGCGESGKMTIKKQTRDWSKKTVYIETAWLPGRIPSGSYGACHYYGPIYGGGAVDTFLGTWKVVIDGKNVGSYTYDIKTEQASEYESSYIKSCSISLN